MKPLLNDLVAQVELPQDTYLQQDAEILDIFIEEVDEIIIDLAPCLEHWYLNLQDRAVLQRLRTYFHTLKGSGRMVGANTSAELAWSVEDLLNRLMAKALQPSQDIILYISTVFDVYRLRLAPDFKLQKPHQIDLRPLILIGQQLQKNQNLDPEYIELFNFVDAEPEHANDSASWHEQAHIAQLATQGQAQDELDVETLAIFIEESTEHLANIRRFLQQNHPDTEHYNLLMRALHTLRGSSAMAGVQHVFEFSAKIEQLFKNLIKDEQLQHEQESDALADYEQFLSQYLKLLSQPYSQQEREKCAAHFAQVWDAYGFVLDAAHAEHQDKQGLVSGLLALNIDHVLDAEHEFSSRLKTEYPDYVVQLIKECQVLQNHTERNATRAIHEYSILLQQCYQALIDKPILIEFDNLPAQFKDAHLALLDLFDQLAAGERLQQLNVPACTQQLLDFVQQQSTVLTTLFAQLHPQTNQAVTVSTEPANQQIQFDLAAIATQLSNDRRSLHSDLVNQNFDADLLDIFLEEAEELLVGMDADLNRWMQDQTDNSALKNLMRYLHTLKGGANMVQTTHMGLIAHELETIYERLIQQRIEVSAPLIAIIRLIQDDISERVQVLREQGIDYPATQALAILKDLDGVIAGNHAAVTAADHDTQAEQIDHSSHRNIAAASTLTFATPSTSSSTSTHTATAPSSDSDSAAFDLVNANTTDTAVNDAQLADTLREIQSDSSNVESIKEAHSTDLDLSIPFDIEQDPSNQPIELAKQSAFESTAVNTELSNTLDFSVDVNVDGSNQDNAGIAYVQHASTALSHTESSTTTQAETALDAVATPAFELTEQHNSADFSFDQRVSGLSLSDELITVSDQHNIQTTTPHENYLSEEDDTLLGANASQNDDLAINDSALLHDNLLLNDNAPQDDDSNQPSTNNDTTTAHPFQIESIQLVEDAIHLDATALSQPTAIDQPSDAITTTPTPAHLAAAQKNSGFDEELSSAHDRLQRLWQQWTEQRSQRSTLLQLQRNSQLMAKMAEQRQNKDMMLLAQRLAAIFEQFSVYNFQSGFYDASIIQALGWLQNSIHDSQHPVAALLQLLQGIQLAPSHHSALDAVQQNSAQLDYVQGAQATPPSMMGEWDNTAQNDQNNEMIRVSADVIEKMIDLSGENAINRSRIEMDLGQLASTLHEMEQTIQRLADQLRRMEGELETQIMARHEQSVSRYADFDPLEMDQYSSLNQLSKSLAESASDLVDFKMTLANKIRDTESLLLQQSRIQAEIQESLMRTRLVPFSRLLPRLQRVVRQTSSTLNRPAELFVQNTEGELDRSILERLVTPLEHMLRNAIDHGLEDQEQRLALNKPQVGRIDLNIQRQGGDVVVTFSDDGKGIDVSKIQQKAVQMGLMNEGQQLSHDDILQFVFHPGFSTASQITQISGRGVGLDVVLSDIKVLGGHVSVSSEMGKGTTFVIRVPTTVAVGDALMVKVGDQQFALPLAQIDRIVRIASTTLSQYFAGQEDLFEIDQVPYKLRYLAEFTDNQQLTHINAIAHSLPVLLIKGSSGQTIAIVVDQLVGSRSQIVVKPVGQQFSNVGVIAGATILGDGQVCLILDAQHLVRQIQATVRVKPKQGQKQPSREIDSRQLIMIVDDSVTVRKVTSRLLERQGFDVVTAKDGVDAIEQLENIQPDLMLLDIEMPRMDGFEVTNLVRHHPIHASLPIIMITSRAGEKHRERAFSLGVNDYMGKPFQEAELLKNIQQLLTVSK